MGRVERLLYPQRFVASGHISHLCSVDISLTAGVATNGACCSGMLLMSVGYILHKEGMLTHRCLNDKANCWYRTLQRVT